MKSKILELASKELQMLPENDQEYFGRWMLKRVNELLAFRKRNGLYPTTRKRAMTNEQKVFIENLCIKHGMKSVLF